MNNYFVLVCIYVVCIRVRWLQWLSRKSVAVGFCVVFIEMVPQGTKSHKAVGIVVIRLSLN